MQPREPHTLKRCNRPITRQRIDRSDADPTALCGFELEVQLDIGEDSLNRVLECGAVVPFSLGQIAPSDLRHPPAIRNTITRKRFSMTTI
jgi:hypothetical protein